MKALEGVHLGTDTRYFELLTRKVFHAGFDKAQVDRRWPAFQRRFFGFDPERVAKMTKPEVERACSDPGLVRNRAKILATVANAKHFRDTARRVGSWEQWLNLLAQRTYEEREMELRKGLTQCGPTTIFYFLYECGAVPLGDKPDHVR